MIINDGILFFFSDGVLSAYFVYRRLKLTIINVRLKLCGMRPPRHVTFYNLAAIQATEESHPTNSTVSF